MIFVILIFRSITLIFKYGCDLQKEIAAIQAKGLTQQQQEEQIAIAKARAASQEEKNNKKIGNIFTKKCANF